MNFSRQSRIFSFLSLFIFMVTFAGVGTSFAAGTPASAQEVQIGVVDMAKALLSIQDGKKARAELEAAVNKKKKELQKEEADIKKMHEELKKQSMVLNEKALAKKQAEIQQRIMKYQEQSGRTQMELQKKERDLTEPLVQKLRDIISNLAKEKGYTVILEKNENNVLFSMEKDDLTEQVINLYNKKS